jgi:DNA repair protein RecO (recombination protein O)
MRRIADEPAYLLHLRPYRETSALVELLTERHGCLAAVARGVRGGRRQRIPVPFVRLRVGLAGRAALLTLTTLENDRVRMLEGRALFSGLYLNELVLRLVRHDDVHPGLFGGYETALAALEAGTDVEAALRRFEKLLLRECGYEVAFDVDAETGEGLDPERVYRYVPDHGFAPCEETADERRTFHGATLLAVGADDYRDASVRRVAKRILRRALAPHLGDHPLESRALFGRRTS